MIELTALKPPPDVPDKWDILPIHTSDRATFKRCRRRWDWSSPLRNNLVPDAEFAGVNMNLWFGTGIHYALANFYDPLLSRDPVETWLTWYRLQWEGGIVEEHELEMFYDQKPKPIGSPPTPDHITDQMIMAQSPLYNVRGLRDIHPDPDPEEFETYRVLGEKMMEFYKDYALRFDEFTVIAAEHTFSIPLGFEAIDPRDGELKPVHYRGTQDAILQHNESGRFGILEHKTAIRVDEQYHRKLEKDEQVTSYMWSGEREAEIHDLEYKRIDFTIYNALRKAYPKPPTLLKNGLFSVNRQTESTTIDMLEEYIRDSEIGPVIEGDEKYEGYINWVREQGYEQFVVRNMVTRNRHEIDSCGERIRMEVMDMLGLYPNVIVPYEHDGSTFELPLIYPNPTGDFMCLNCQFRAPCIGRDDGSDWEQMIEDNYIKNPNR